MDQIEIDIKLSKEGKYQEMINNPSHILSLTEAQELIKYGQTYCKRIQRIINLK
jgi:hypothetical protein